MINKVIVDKKVLDSFKRRALRVYPKEYIESCWGKLVNDRAEIHVMLNIEHWGTTREIYIDHDENDASPVPYDDDLEYKGYVWLGMIHTHPGGDCIPSDVDIVSSHLDGEQIQGILSIRKTAKRRFCSWGFWHKGEQIELEITDD